MVIKLPKVTGNNVMIKLSKERKTKSGIIMPDEVVDYNFSFAGDVVKVGKDCEEIKKGYFAFFRQGVGRVIEDAGIPTDANYVVVCEEDVVAYYETRSND